MLRLIEKSRKTGVPMPLLATGSSAVWGPGFGKKREKLETQAKPPAPPWQIYSTQSGWGRRSACLDFCQRLLAGSFFPWRRQARTFALLACSLVVCLLFTACGRKSVAGVEVDSKLKNYIPAKSKILAGIDLEKIKKTDFYRRHQSELSLPQLNKLTEQTGIDPRRDLSYFLMAWDETDVLAMFRGPFDPTTMKKQLNGKVEVEKFQDLVLYGDGKRDVVFMPKEIALVGPAALLKQVIGGSGGVPEGLQTELVLLNKGAQAWFVSSGVISLDKLSLRSDTAANLANISDYINATAVGFTLSSGVAMDTHISCISEEGSQRVHDAIRGIIGLARLSTKDDQLDQLKIWDSIKVEKQGKDVHVTADLPADLVDQFLKTMSGMTKRS